MLESTWNLKWAILTFAALTAVVSQTSAAAARQGVRFQKITLTERYYCDGIAATDINSDGNVDIVAGPYWYAGPQFRQAHEFYPAEVLDPAASPSNSMFSFVHDFSGDGYPDILVLGRVHMHQAFWYENPGTEDGDWQKHFAFERVRGESPAFQDVNTDGRPELLTHWDGRWGFIRPDPTLPREPWTFTAIGDNEDWPQFYHGEGIGDVNDDGRPDVVLTDGWYEQPESTNPKSSEWPFHRGRFTDQRGGAQMFTRDVDEDGDADVITALHAHEWGLAWLEQIAGDADNGESLRRVGDRTFREHVIMSDRSRESEFGVAFSQPHALEVADIDGDGHDDIVTGKRMWAHGPNGDVEPAAAPVLYWFQRSRLDDGTIRFIPHRIDDRSGVGVQIAVDDVNKDGRPDVLTASKIGAFVFLNLPESP